MKIQNFRSERLNGRKRVLASVQWEDCDRPSRDIYFETEEEFGNDLECNPNAFLISCIVPALHHGERRVLVEAAICPELKSGLFTAMSLLCNWNLNSNLKIVHIEAKKGFNNVNRHKKGNAALFFSGGIDSLACLRANRLIYPRDHHGYFRDAIMIYGQNIESDNNPATFASTVQSFQDLTQDTGITLIPIYTNNRCLDENLDLFKYKSHSAILTAVAHAFSPRLSLAAVASTFDIPNLPSGWGSHPMLDPNYSSSELRIRHDNIALPRFEKIKLITSWDKGLHNIRVCSHNWPGRNCGECEKCLCTMLGLLALGYLEKTTSFPTITITRGLLLEKLLLSDTSVPFYRELLSPLLQIGRNDLVYAINLKIEEYYRNSRMRSLRDSARRLDDRYLYGGIGRLKRLLFDSILYLSLSSTFLEGRGIIY